MAQKLWTLEKSRALDDDPNTLWWYYWEAMEGRMPPTHAHYVPVGFFRYDTRNGKSYPLAIWREADGIKRAQVGGGATITFSTPEIEGAFAFDTFASCCKKPITYEAYEFWKANRAWPPTEGTQAVIEESLKVGAGPGAGAGDNSGAVPEVGHETFKDQVAAALKGVEAAAKISTDDHTGPAQSLRSRLTELAGEGDKLRVVEKEPHLTASRAVDEKWSPTIREAKDGARTLKTAIESYENKVLREKRERAAAEAAASKPVVTVTSGADPAPAPVAAPEQRTVKGAYGKAAGVRMRKQITEIDYDKVYAALQATNPEIRPLLMKLAQRIIDAGGEMDGVKYEMVAAIR